MRNLLVYICSPLRGDLEGNMAKARNYCRKAIEKYPNIVPIAPHIYCTQFTDDTIPEEREAGLEMGVSLLSLCSEMWVFGMDSPSSGMMGEISFATSHGIPVRDARELFPEL